MKRLSCILTAACMLAATSPATLTAVSPAGVRSAPSVATPVGAPTEVGAGWDGIVCAGCIAAGVVALSAGAAGWPILIANAELVGAAAATCITACRNAME